MRFELTTPTLARLCSTPELRPLERPEFTCLQRRVYAPTFFLLQVVSWQNFGIYGMANKKCCSRDENRKNTLVNSSQLLLSLCFQGFSGFGEDDK